MAGPIKNENAGKGNGQTELPMPKDAHLLCQMSQALLQAARAGRVNRPSPSGEEEVKAVGGGDDEEGGGAGAGKDEGERSFTAMRWQLVPRHLEGPEVEYLAKRRKVVRSRNGGLPTGVVMKRVTIRRVDLEGNSLVEDILVADGQPIDGEILAEVVVTETPGTMVDGVGVVNADGMVVSGDGMQPTPPRRRPPPPKRKPKGPGRGRKKKVQFASGRDGTEGIVAVDDGVIQPATVQAVVSGADGIEVVKADDDLMDGNKAKESEDTEMIDDSNLPEDEGEVEEEEEGEEGEEGEEIEDDDREEGELSPSPEPEHEPEREPPSIQNLASPTKTMPMPMPTPTPRKYSSGALQLNPTGLTHPLPPKPESAILFTSKPASRAIANFSQLQQGYNDHRPVQESRERQQADLGLAHQRIEQSNNAPVTDQPLVESSTSAVDVTQTPTKERPSSPSNVEIVEPMQATSGGSKEDTIMSEDMRIKDTTEE